MSGVGMTGTKRVWEKNGIIKHADIILNWDV